MADELTVDIVTPNEHAYQGPANGVRAPGVEGSFEVRKDHAPMIAAFGIGPLIVKTQAAHEYADMRGDRIVFATSGGFLEILDNKVTVLAETVEPASEIDVDRAENAEERARPQPPPRGDGGGGPALIVAVLMPTTGNHDPRY